MRRLVVLTVLAVFGLVAVETVVLAATPAPPAVAAPVLAETPASPRPITSPSTFAMGVATIAGLLWLRWRQRRFAASAAR
jgi:hypothetical protein